MRHPVPSRAHACRVHWTPRPIVPLLIVAILACRDVTTPSTNPHSPVTRVARRSMQATDFASLVAASDDARNRLLAPLEGKPGVDALSDAIDRLSVALAVGDASAAYRAIPALESALANAARAVPAAAADLDAVQLLIARTAQALDEARTPHGP